jgi:hypothetical protein
MDIKQTKLKQAIEECSKHVLYLQHAHEKLKSIFFTFELLNEILPDDVEPIDQLIYRFSKLQDTMGEKLFPIILSILEENVDGMPMIDIINKMEKLSIIESADNWLFLRKLRNELAHEYPDEPGLQAQILNKLVLETNRLIDIFRKIEDYLVNKRIVIK